MNTAQQIDAIKTNLRDGEITPIRAHSQFAWAMEDFGYSAEEADKLARKRIPAWLNGEW